MAASDLRCGTWDLCCGMQDLCCCCSDMWDLIPSCSVTKLCLTLCDLMDCMQHARLPCPSLSPRIYSQLMSMESVLPSNHAILCCPLLLLSSIFPSIRVFSNESALRIRWTKYWSFSFIISPSNEHSGLISFRIDWFDLLAVQGHS